MQIVRNGKGKGDKTDKGGKGAPPGGRPALLLALALIAPALAAQAQQYDVLISLSGDDVLPSGPVRDQDIVLQPTGQVAHVMYPSETLSLLAGDKGTGNWPVFTDIDAVADVGGATADQGLYISISSDEAGFKDGDVIKCGPGGMTVWRTELAFMTATGCTDGNVDLDALQIDADGTIVFSFADNEASSFLSGDGTGIIKDGDVLTWAPGALTAQILYTETQINALVKHALNSSTAVSTTDTKDVAREPFTGALLFAVQSPTSDDATVFSDANGGSIVAGHAESDLGFTVGPEIDALSVAVSHFPALTVSNGKPQAGDPLTLSLTDAWPGLPHIVLASLSGGNSKPALSGWGACVLQPDALLFSTWHGAMLIVPDATGAGSVTTILPPGIPATDIVVQAVAPPFAGVPRGTNPIVIELAQ
jgi:hypothetical protein